MQYVPLIFAAAAAYILFRSFKIIGQAEVMVIERLGRFHRVARSGLNILIPILERPKELDVRYLESDVGEFARSRRAQRPGSTCASRSSTSRRSRSSRRTT